MFDLGFDGAIISADWKDRYGPSSSRARHHDGDGRRAIQHSQESLRVAGKAPHGINQKTVAKWKKPDLGRRPADRARRTPHSSVLSLEQANIPDQVRDRLSPTHAAAARRLPLCLTSHDSASEPVGPASLLATSQHLSVARRRRGEACQEEVQGLGSKPNQTIDEVR